MKRESPPGLLDGTSPTATPWLIMSRSRSVALLSLSFVALCLGPAPILSETIFTQTEKITGAITRQSDLEVVIKPKNGAERVLPRGSILTIHDDEAKLLWSNPLIVTQDTTPEAKKPRIELPAEDSRLHYKGLHLGLSGAYGVLWPNATFSTFPLGTSPDYRAITEINATGAWYFDDTQAIVGGLGYGARKIPVRSISAAGFFGDGYWPMDYLDVRIAYRIHSDIFFVEGGLLTAIKLSNPVLIVETTNRTITSDTYNTRTYLALSFALGVNLQLTKQLFGLAMIRIDHAISAAVTGNAPTATDVSGAVLSTAPIALVPFGGTIQLGLAWRL